MQNNIGYKEERGAVGRSLYMDWVKKVNTSIYPVEGEAAVKAIVQ
ncbi:hypothetical protein [Parabacteroides faecis]